MIIFKPVTPLHVGAGRGLEEAVDLPLQRDNLGLPVIWGS
ncbi:MAG: type III-B CRISPR module RAMP protein Cmr4, partial [Thermoprotei archaeon]